MHRDGVDVAVAIVIDGIGLVGLAVATNLKLFKVKVHWDGRACDVFRPPAKQHVGLHAVLPRLADQVHRRHQIQNLAFQMR